MENKKFALGKENYIWIIIGCLVVAFGFILMVGGGSEDPNVFNEDELFSARRITIAPILCVIGYVLVIFGIMKKRKVTKQ
jgi:uncharacterized membrane protein